MVFKKPLLNLPDWTIWQRYGIRISEKNRIFIPFCVIPCILLMSRGSSKNMLGRLTTWQVIVSAKASSSCSAARFIFAQFLSLGLCACALKLSTRFRKLESTWKNKDTVKKRFASHLQSDKNTTVQLNLYLLSLLLQRCLMQCYALLWTDVGLFFWTTPWTFCSMTH